MNAPIEAEDTELVEVSVQDGQKVDWKRFGVPVTMDVYWHEPTTYALWDGFNHVAIDIEGMSFGDVCAAVKHAVQSLKAAMPTFCSGGIH